MTRGRSKHAGLADDPLRSIATSLSFRSQSEGSNAVPHRLKTPLDSLARVERHRELQRGLEILRRVLRAPYFLVIPKIKIFLNIRSRLSYPAGYTKSSSPHPVPFAIFSSNFRQLVFCFFFSSSSSRHYRQLSVRVDRPRSSANATQNRRPYSADTGLNNKQCSEQKCFLEPPSLSKVQCVV